MRFFYKDTYINYYFKHRNDKLIVFLHGWGDGSVLLEPVDIALSKNVEYSSLKIDFPPFGKSREPKISWTIYDYANLTKKIIIEITKKHEYSQLILICHSFGGRVGTILSSENDELNISKLVLIDSAGIKPRRSLMFMLKIIKAKIFKFFKIKRNNLGSKDYQKLSKDMKQTFKNVVNEDLSYLLTKIKAKTLIIYGEKDKDTPLYMAKKFNKKIRDSHLVIVKNAGHFSYIDSYILVNKLIENFIM